MAPALEELLDPRHTAVVTVECQVGVIGADAIFPELAAAARATVVPAAARLVEGARAAGARVVHCLALRRPDGLGANRNARLFAAAAKAPVGLLPGSPQAAVVPEIGVADSDLVTTRLHGLSPMAGTDLDALLRNLGIRTLVVAGVSVNVAITNLVMDAVNAGYQVVLPRDAVAGVPPEYADAMIDHTLSLLATVTTVDEVLTAWATGAKS